MLALGLLDYDTGILWNSSWEMLKSPQRTSPRLEERIPLCLET